MMLMRQIGTAQEGGGRLNLGSTSAVPAVSDVDLDHVRSSIA